jgi:hypothetical protein
MSTESDLQKAVAAGLLSAEQCSRIVAFLKTAGEPATDAGAPPAQFNLTHVLWYGGALIIMTAMGIFSTTAFSLMGGWGLFATGAAYAVGLWLIGRHLWQARGLRVPGGLLIAASVSMVPMMIYGVQDALDLWRYAQGEPGSYHDFFPYVHGSWLYMEIGTLLAAVVALRFYKVPFLLLVAGVALWFMSMDLAMWFTAKPDDFGDLETRRLVSLIFGLVVIAAAWAIDLARPRGPDLAFWLHIFGALTFWGALTASPDSTALLRFVYFLINLALIGLALFLDRRVYAVFGAIGVAFYLGYLAYDVFPDMIMFSFALSAIGLGVIGLGLWLNRHYAALSAAIDANTPAPLRGLRPKRETSA